MDVKDINRRIKKEFCKKTEKSISYETLKKTYLKTKGYRTKEKEIKEIMEEIGISEEHIELFMEKYQDKLVGAGMKGNVRGIKFNKIVKKKILALDLDEDRFIVKFEKRNDKIHTAEIPDWYIECKETGKVIIGMNQLDFWGGGQQYNRGDKYLKEDYITEENGKILNVICNFKMLVRKRSKIYNFFNIGFQKDTLCYVKGIKRIINEYFDL